MVCLHNRTYFDHQHTHTHTAWKKHRTNIDILIKNDDDDNIQGYLSICMIQTIFKWYFLCCLTWLTSVKKTVSFMHRKKYSVAIFHSEKEIEWTKNSYISIPGYRYIFNPNEFWHTSIKNGIGWKKEKTQKRSSYAHRQTHITTTRGW